MSEPTVIELSATEVPRPEDLGGSPPRVILGSDGKTVPVRLRARTGRGDQPINVQWFSGLYAWFPPNQMEGVSVALIRRCQTPSEALQHLEEMAAMQRWTLHGMEKYLEKAEAFIKRRSSRPKRLRTQFGALAPQKRWMDQGFAAGGFVLTEKSGVAWVEWQLRWHRDLIDDFFQD